MFRPLRAHLEPTGHYRFLDSLQRIGATHKETNTRLRILSSNAKTAFGLGADNPILLADEPGAWETITGGLMHDAVQTALGKPGSTMRVIYIGTVAPSTTGWWAEMVEAGSNGSTYVQALQGNRDKWRVWREIMRVNPLAKISERMRNQLKQERTAAARDPRLKARFLSYRLNLPSADSSEMLLDVEDFRLACDRHVPDRDGKPIVGIDLGGGRAWSAATAVWENGPCRRHWPLLLVSLLSRHRRRGIT